MATRKSLLQHGITIVLSSFLFFSQPGSAQVTPAQNTAQSFQAYFDAVATEPHNSQRGTTNEATRERLAEMIPTMSTAELQRAVSTIDRAIDQARASHDGIARMYAGMFLFYISATKDGPSLLAPEVSKLSALCSDPYTLAGAANMFSYLPLQYPELTVPALLQAIKSPDANAPLGKGPAYATILLLSPPSRNVEKDVLVYMQRPDLTGQKLLDFLTGIRAISLMPDAVVEQLTRYLDAPQPEVRLAALRDISAGGFAERKRLKPLFQRLADDPIQSDAFHTLAVELLDSNKMFSLNPYQ